MLAVLIANIKGGCGKTTVATHLAAAFAADGHKTVLADADRQRSSLGWLGVRPANAAPITGIDWTKDFDRPPKQTGRLIIDAPAALKGKQIEDLVRMCDLIITPVLPGAFDEAATRRFIDKLEELKPIARNKKGVAIIGNRLRPRTRAADRLDLFLEASGHQVITRLRDSQFYPESAAQGLSLFDLKGKRVSEARDDWTALLAFIAACPVAESA